MLRLQGVSKKFGGVVAVNDVSLQLRPGEIFGFLGPNGAGKTTTVRLAVGLLTPDSGNVYIGDRNVVDEPEAAKALIGYVPDRSLLYPKISGREYLTFLSRVHQLPQPHGQRIQQWLELMSLVDAADATIETYSHGMQKRLTWIGALMHDPSLLFLDEPTEGLDPASARMAKDLLKRFKERGRTVFICTHIMELAQSLCDRVGIMSGGRLLAVGSLDELRATSAMGSESLEDVFLELTGAHSSEVGPVLQALLEGEPRE